MIFTLGILDPESDSIPTAASIFSLLPFFPFSLLFFLPFFSLLFFFVPPILTFLLVVLPLPSIAPSSPSSTASLPSPSIHPVSFLAPVAILRSSSILRPRTLRFFPPFFSYDTSSSTTWLLRRCSSRAAMRSPRARHRL